MKPRGFKGSRLDESIQTTNPQTCTQANLTPWEITPNVMSILHPNLWASVRTHAFPPRILHSLTHSVKTLNTYSPKPLNDPLTIPLKSLSPTSSVMQLPCLLPHAKLSLSHLILEIATGPSRRVTMGDIKARGVPTAMGIEGEGKRRW